MAFVTSLDSISVSKMVAEILSYPDWCVMLKEEMEPLNANGTWNIMPLPADKKAISCKWVFIVKTNPDGYVARLKAHLVAKKYDLLYIGWIILKRSPSQLFHPLPFHPFISPFLCSPC